MAAGGVYRGDGRGLHVCPRRAPSHEGTHNIHHNFNHTPQTCAQCSFVCGNRGLAEQKVAPIRRALGVRTAFNIVGPMLNAAEAQNIVIGVFHEVLLTQLLSSQLVQTLITQPSEPTLTTSKQCSM